MNRTTWIILLSLIALAPACLSDGSGGSSGSGSLGPLSISGQVIECDVDSDCTVLELGCCDSCNGGWSASVNKDYADGVTDRNHDTCAGNEICTDMWCGHSFPRCENNTCTSRTEDWQTCENDDDCVVVEIGCCDHCNGGDVVASNKDYSADVKEVLGEE